jgi:hypothetical protein
MRKLATMFVLMITFSMVFAGAVSAQEPATVDVTVLDENGNPVDVTCPGDVVVTLVNATANDEDIPDPYVDIAVDPENGIDFDPASAIMYYCGDKYTNDPNDPFFYWNEDLSTWEWWIGWAVDDNDMYPGEDAQLFVGGIVKAVGPITVTGDFYAWPEESEDPILLDSDSYTFLSVPCHHCQGATVPMQNTGAPLAALALGMLSIIGGAVYGKLR